MYVPNGNMNGISRKLPDTERSRLKRILKEVLPEKVGVIVRTAAEGATEEQLTLDVNRLISQWAAISENVKSLQAPALLHGEPDLLIKIIRDVFNEDFHKLVISGTDARQTIEGYLAQVAPDLVDRIEVYGGQKDIFDEFRISEQIEKALDRKVWLPSGGSLVIDRTEAMTVVDVNTGKFVGSGGNLEETVTKNNLEAADEVVRQMRLRDIGGIIVVDFIDMVLESNRDLVLRRLVECLSRDRTKHQVAEVTSLGLVQMTRKKLGLGLLESFSEPCEVCAGRGVVIHHDPVSKHRTQQQTPQPEQRRSRGGKGGASNGGGNGGSSSNGSTGSNGSNGASHSNGVTHSITPAAQNALAQIAASTIAAANGQKVPAASTTAGASGAFDTAADASAADTADSSVEAAPAGVADAPGGRRHRCPGTCCSERPARSGCERRPAGVVVVVGLRPFASRFTPVARSACGGERCCRRPGCGLRLGRPVDRGSGRLARARSARAVDSDRARRRGVCARGREVTGERREGQWRRERRRRERRRYESRHRERRRCERRRGRRRRGRRCECRRECWSRERRRCERQRCERRRGRRRRGRRCECRRECRCRERRRYEGRRRECRRECRCCEHRCRERRRRG